MTYLVSEWTGSTRSPTPGYTCQQMLWKVKEQMLGVYMVNQYFLTYDKSGSLEAQKTQGQ